MLAPFLLGGCSFLSIGSQAVFARFFVHHRLSITILSPLQFAFFDSPPFFFFPKPSKTRDSFLKYLLSNVDRKPHRLSFSDSSGPFSSLSPLQGTTLYYHFPPHTILFAPSSSTPPTGIVRPPPFFLFPPNTIICARRPVPPCVSFGLFLAQKCKPSPEFFVFKNFFPGRDVNRRPRYPACFCMNPTFKLRYDLSVGIGRI